MLLILHFLFRKNEEKKEPAELPFVSVLIAVRNEEGRILHCLKALEKLDYPPEKIEVLIGDDQSEDNTKSVVLDFIGKKEIYRLIEVKERMGNAKGKANVLAHLAQEAKGDFFFITDADMEVPSSWIRSLLGYWDEKTGTVSGVTFIRGSRLFDRLQCLEWIFAFGMVQAVSERNIPVSAVGNNMMISRKAYESTGGYGKIPFSVTEDFELFRQTLLKGWGFKNRMDPSLVASSEGVDSFLNLLRQRKRWMSGAFQLPFVLVLSLFLQSVFLPVIILTLILFPFWGIMVWILKFTLEVLFLFLVIRAMGLKGSLLKYSPLFEIYSGALSFVLLLYYALPGKIEWKGRKY